MQFLASSYLIQSFAHFLIIEEITMDDTCRIELLSTLTSINVAQE